MKVWELRNGRVNETAPLVYANDDEMQSGMFDASGQSLVWKHRPQLAVFKEPRRKQPKPRAEVLVYDQYVTPPSPKATGPRVLRWGAHVRSNNGDNFYVAE